MNQHDFFISRNRVQELSEVESGQLYFTFCSVSVNQSQTAGLLSRWETLPDPDSGPPKKEPGLADLFAEIRTTVAQEAQIVQAVFPNPPMVMQVFLQRVFAQSVGHFSLVPSLQRRELLAISLLSDPTISRAPPQQSLESLSALFFAHAPLSALADLLACGWPKGV